MSTSAVSTVKAKKYTEAKPLTLSQAPSRAKQLLRAGDVLVSMTRPNLNAVALVPEQLDGAIGSTGFHVLRSRWLRPEFLLRLVQSQRFVDEMSALVQGALYPAVRPKDIAAFTFAFETPAQQSRIAAKLEELLSDLDAGVAELKAAQKNWRNTASRCSKPQWKACLPLSGGRKTRHRKPGRNCCSASSPSAAPAGKPGSLPGAEQGQNPTQGLAKQIPRTGAARYHRFAGIAAGVGVGDAIPSWLAGSWSI